MPYKTRLLPASWGMDGVQTWVVDRFANMRLFNGKSLSTLALASQVVIGLEVEKRAFDVFQYVDPLIGTANGGMSY
jgi:predicted alternative tryptophan synthase beta-subunit